jgi:quercetin dioxygenase-like cupin family protein
MKFKEFAERIGNYPSFPMSVTTVARADIPKIHSAIVDGKEYSLGVLHDFSWHPALQSSFLSEVSISWVHLEAGQTLDVHSHSSESIIIVCQGSVLSIGEREELLQEGDILLIPQDAAHGFIGAGKAGFWGLSIQPAKKGIYSDPANAKVEFISQRPGRWVEDLVALNDIHLKTFSKNPLFMLFNSGLLSEPGEMERFLSLFQIWSDCFQDLLRIRVSGTPGSKFHALALTHLAQEAGHNTQIRNARKTDTPAKFDTITESYCSWFREQMRNSSEVEQAVLMHIVIEASADIFYSHFSSASANQSLSSHIREHLHHDTEHFQMGLRVLQEHTEPNPEKLLRLQERAWSILGALFARFQERLSEK